jgi:hypothetical protein
VLATLAQRVDLQLIQDQRIEPLALITLRPRYGVRMTISALRPQSVPLPAATP